MAGTGIRAEYHEVVIAVGVEVAPTDVLAGGSTAWFIQIEYRKRVTAMIAVYAISIGIAHLSRFAHVAIVVPEILGWREDDIRAHTRRRQSALVTRFPGPRKELVHAHYLGSTGIRVKPPECIDSTRDRAVL